MQYPPTLPCAHHPVHTPPCVPHPPTPLQQAVGGCVATALVPHFTASHNHTPVPSSGTADTRPTTTPTTPTNGGTRHCMGAGASRGHPNHAPPHTRPPCRARAPLVRHCTHTQSHSHAVAGVTRTSGLVCVSRAIRSAWGDVSSPSVAMVAAAAADARTAAVSGCGVGRHCKHARVGRWQGWVVFGALQGWCTAAVSICHMPPPCCSDLAACSDDGCTK